MSDEYNLCLDHGVRSCATCLSTAAHVILDETMSSDGGVAVDREALWRVVEQHYGEHPEAFVRSLLSSGVLRDADGEMVKEQQLANSPYWEGHSAGWAEGRDELRAAIEAYLDPQAGMATAPFGDGKRYFSEDGLRALLADDGAAALREHDAKVAARERDAVTKAIVDYRWDVKTTATQDFRDGLSAAASIAQQDRDAAEYRCDRCGHEHDPADPGQCIIPASRLNAGETT